MGKLSRPSSQTSWQIFVLFLSSWVILETTLPNTFQLIEVAFPVHFQAPLNRIGLRPDPYWIYRESINVSVP